MSRSVLKPLELYLITVNDNSDGIPTARHAEIQKVVQSGRDSGPGSFSELGL